MSKSSSLLLLLLLLVLFLLLLNQNFFTGLKGFHYECFSVPSSLYTAEMFYFHCCWLESGTHSSLYVPAASTFFPPVTSSHFDLLYSAFQLLWHHLFVLQLCKTLKWLEFPRLRYTHPHPATYACHQKYHQKSGGSKLSHLHCFLKILPKWLLLFSDRYQDLWSQRQFLNEVKYIQIL